jgi:hypothetical protein
MRDFIINFVSNEGGCKFTDLYLEGIKRYTYDQLSSTVCQLVQEGELIEVRYYLKDVHGERMGFLLPKDTSVKIAKQIF